MINYIDDFPLKGTLLPEGLKNLLLPVNDNPPDLMIEITMRQGTPAKKNCHMTMVTIPKSKIKSIRLIKDLADSGVISYSTPDCDKLGALKNLPQLPKNYDYLIASFGNSCFYNYNLSEKVWMTLGLSQRCIGNDDQSIVYDDLHKPIMSVAKGEATYEHLGKLSRNITWKMRNDYVREYLWMRGHVGVRVFYYEQLIEDTPEIRALIGGQYRYNSSNEWYDMNIFPLHGKFFLEVWATVVAVLPVKIPEKNIYTLKWPGDNQPMSENRILPFMQSSSYKYIYLKDEFLEKYEKSHLYYSVPMIDPDGYILCPI